MDDVSCADWNACAYENGQCSNPFITYEFLHALEASGSATEQTGWLARHMLLRQENQPPLAVMPLYIKTNSQGEYVFDQAWAEAFHRAGGSYYPKLQASAPFTPVTGPRVLVREQSNQPAIFQAFDQAIKSLCDRFAASSAHITFMQKDQWRQMLELGWHGRTDIQFHWKNRDYSRFDDFLNQLSSRKRKNIRKERRFDDSFSFEHITGNQLESEHFDVFYRFYLNTGSRKWGRPYLTREFFEIIRKTIPDQIVLILVKRHDHYIAGALNFRGGDTLYGRYWGAVEHHPNLHFETCYYQAIDYAIKHRLKNVEAGAQGPHKLARGYVPVTTYSAHYIAHDQFSEAIERYLQEERSYVAKDNELLSAQTPFKKA